MAVSKPGFRLTRRAIQAMGDIHAHSVKQWGRKKADAYLATIYTSIAKASARPDLGRQRTNRSTPFLAIPAGQHFIIYDQYENGIVIVTLLHQRRNIERIIANLKPACLAEIEAIRNSGN